MAGTQCANCGSENDPGQLVCTKCGTLLFNSSVSTVHMRIDPTLLRLRRAADDESAVEAPENTVVLTVRGMSEKLVFEENTEVVLGRADTASLATNRLDLSRFGAHERGVSREHALLRFANNELTLTDLKTVNGTSVNQLRLEPNKPYVLTSGDELMLGTLTIVVRFEPRVPKPPKPVDTPPDAEVETLKFNKNEIRARLDADEAHKSVDAQKIDDAKTDDAKKIDEAQRTITPEKPDQPAEQPGTDAKPGDAV